MEVLYQVFYLSNNALKLIFMDKKLRNIETQSIKYSNSIAADILLLESTCAYEGSSFRRL